MSWWLLKVSATCCAQNKKINFLKLPWKTGSLQTIPRKWILCFGRRCPKTLLLILPPNANILDDEVDKVCQAFGRILVLLDEIFACMNTEGGGASNEVKMKLTNRLELAQVKRNELNFLSTPKWHVLLNHAANQLADMDGFTDMGEDCIEQNHQSRKKDRHQHSRLRNPQQAKNS
jgi:hypothetical protein